VEAEGVARIGGLTTFVNPGAVEEDALERKTHGNPGPSAWAYLQTGALEPRRATGKRGKRGES